MKLEHRHGQVINRAVRVEYHVEVALPDARPLVIAIDDNHDILALLQIAAQRTQHTCTMLTACSGVDGLQHITDHADRVEVVVLDVRMPDLDGRWLCAAVRCLAPHARVLPFTGDEEGWKIMCYFGALAPLMKPASIGMITQALSQALIAPSPPPPDPVIAGFFAEQMPDQLRLARDRGSQIRVAMLASDHLQLALDVALPRASGVIELATDDISALRAFLAKRLVQVLVTTPEHLAKVEELAVETRTPLLVCATMADAPTIPAAYNVVSRIEDRGILSTALCTVGAGGHYREVPARHPAFAQFTPRQQQVLSLVRQGHTLKTLPDALGISYGRTRHVLRELYQCCGVSSFHTLQDWLAEQL